MTISRRREPGAAEVWRIHVNQQPTRLMIRKGPKPRYRMPQLWELYDESWPDIVLLVQTGPEHTLKLVRKMMRICLTPIIDRARPVKPRSRGGFKKKANGQDV